MSKAFTKEDGIDVPELVPARAPLPEGVINYVTTRGLALLEAEQQQLQTALHALSQQSLSETDKRLQQASLQARLSDLDLRLQSAQWVDSQRQPQDKVHFGACVDLLTEADEQKHYQIVGVDEADAASGRISFLSPLARALLGLEVGDVVELTTPNGLQELEIIAIRYP